MTPAHRVLGAVLTAGLLLTLTATGSDAVFGGESDGAAMLMKAREARAAELASAGSDPATRLIEYRRRSTCTRSSVDTTTDLNGACSTDAGQVPLPFCEGLEPVLPLWAHRRETPASPWSAWYLVVSWSCPQDQFPAVTLEDLERLPLAPPTLRVQPAAPTVLVNIETITMTDATTQHFTIDLLGYPVEVEATPSAFVWDYGDGSEPVRTTSPGHPYPDHDVFHEYRAPGTYTITLTAELTGRYRLAGTTQWLPVTGTATTTATSPPITAVEAPVHLVDGPCTTADC